MSLWITVKSSVTKAWVRVCSLWVYKLARCVSWTHFRVFSFLSSALACCSLMMVAFTWGGFMWTLSFPPTSKRTVAANFVWVFSTWGGCFSMMKVLRETHTRTHDEHLIKHWHTPKPKHAFLNRTEQDMTLRLKHDNLNARQRVSTFVLHQSLFSPSSGISLYYTL